ncbi:Very-long-chain 3-oxoacyl-CoA reductase [Nymphaea thermarum]|nr:Very-long-chain 3-oxoacyl-CoA reductase [Nymphaea thermarum]
MINIALELVTSGKSAGNAPPSSMDTVLSITSSMEVSMAFQILLILCIVLGLFHLLKAFLSLSQWVWDSFLMPMKDLKQYGSWAVVTGPTDGIGKSIVFGLARLGLNLVLVGRNPAKLNSVAGEIHTKFESVKVRSIVVDFSREVDEGMKRIEEGIKELDVGILINNAGTNLPDVGFMHEVEVEDIGRIIRVNLEALTRVTHVVLPLMVRKRRGIVLNLGSAAGSVLPAYPLSAVYGATKAISAARDASRLDFRRGGHVHPSTPPAEWCTCAQAPFFVETKMTGMKASLFVPTADDYAEWCLLWIGNHGQSVCSPHWAHSILWLAARLLPEALLHLAVFRVMLRRQEKRKKEENDRLKA